MNENRKNALIIVNNLTTPELEEVKDSIHRMEVGGFGIQINLVHVGIRIPAQYFRLPHIVKNVFDLQEEGKSELKKVGKLLNIELKNQWIVLGHIKTEAVKLANLLDANIILTGSSIYKTYFHNFSSNDMRYALPIRTIETLQYHKTRNGRTQGKRQTN